MKESGWKNRDMKYLIKEKHALDWMAWFTASIVWFVAMVLVPSLFDM